MSDTKTTLRDVATYHDEISTIYRQAKHMDGSPQASAAKAADNQDRMAATVRQAIAAMEEAIERLGQHGLDGFTWKLRASIGEGEP